MFFIVLAGLAYVLLAIALPTLAAGALQEPDGREAAFWRGVATAPDDISLAGLRRHFGDLEGRIREMERQVTSGDLDLRRKFRDL